MKVVTEQSLFGGFLVSTVGRLLSMEGSRVYVELAAAESQQGMILHICVDVGLKTPHLIYCKVENLGSPRHIITSSGIELATFPLVSQHLRYQI